MCAEMKSFQVVLWLRIGRRRHAVPLEQVRDRLMREVVTEVGQCACNPIVAPTGVLAGHVDNEILDDRINAWAARMLTTFGTVEFVGDQSTIPGQNGLRSGNAGDLRQIFPAKAFGDAGQCGALRVREPELSMNVGAEDSILGDQV